MRFSKLCLGTAQLGMPYGISNVTGQPSLEESRAILQLAFENGITTFDTAPAYGESEKVLGRCLQELGVRGKFVSKVSRLDWRKSQAEMAAHINSSLHSSLENLRVDSLSGCLFHHFDDMEKENGAALEILLSIKNSGLVESIGASVYTPAEAEACLMNPHCEVIQVPFNLADQRLLAIDFFRRAKERGKTVFVRSVFLQGLFFRPTLPSELQDFEPFRRRLENIAREEGISLNELALRFALSFKDIDSVIVGVETADQLRQNLDILRRGKLRSSLLSMVRHLGSAPLHIIDPRLWPPTPAKEGPKPNKGPKANQGPTSEPDPEPNREPNLEPNPEPKPKLILDAKSNPNHSPNPMPMSGIKPREDSS